MLAAKAGVDPATVREALLGGFAGSKILEVHGQRMLRETSLQDSAPRCISRTPGSSPRRPKSWIPTPSFAVAAAALGTLVATGRGDLDRAALVTVLEDRAGVTVSSEGRA